ncbi:hypothetical protein HMPREF9098_0219 [Kingella denitrificans ATCC 33394]|uniref:Uncharacterized protein n=1 Tax=Kingella denitrificans ATCC 33394 TaxID=888741 RepID=F0EX72_9NEIS|nr:hypothetical protein HMPREF9098_0219 [Kingella denitrificans ATCC 33394]
MGKKQPAHGKPYVQAALAHRSGSLHNGIVDENGNDTAVARRLASFLF